MSRHKKGLLMLVGWGGFVVIYLTIAHPILSLYAVDGMVNYENVIPAFTTLFALIFPLLYLFTASIQILIVTTVEVFGNED